ncbi:hypothetical protein JCM19297_584 [Nonlabens ulvanivorans]|nr:hypothetical protein JCM19297_584 [Nonlabens ulvanivorans]
MNSIFNPNKKVMKNTVNTIIAISLALYSIATSAQRTDPKNQDKELGAVSWYRDYSTALQLSKEYNKPVLILFQEVPGCATCRNYGHNVLSNPLMTEAIQNEFIPLAIFNNKDGKDKDVLKIYKEPAWNNPVVRIVDYDGVDIVDRVGNDYSAQGLYSAMENALKVCKKEIPQYMKILAKELYGHIDSRNKETYYRMYCFWSGEKLLGTQPGILNTEAGFMNGYEVVKVTYDSTALNINDLNSYANSQEMRPIKKDQSYRISSKDEDYYLKHSNYQYLPLSPLQRTLINSALGNRNDAQQYLSPQQKKWYAQSRKTDKTLYLSPFGQAWKERMYRS